VLGVRLVVTYDGSDFVGWQRQPGQRSVQGTLEEAVGALEGRPVAVRGASRTDAGVHAHGQVAAFDTAREIPRVGWVRGLNGKLPPDVAVRDAAPCPVGYRPRFDAVAKTYRYLLHLGPVRDPLLRDRAWHLGPRRARPGGRERRAPEDWLDLDAMDAAARALVGEHDFRAFRSSADDRENTRRTLTSVRVERRFAGRDDVVALEVRGTAFMHHMVRILTGTLVEVGRERMSPKDVAALLSPDADRRGAGETAPAHGLYLVSIELGRR
jgi:tRNA pseudouridine38-40 synthase